MTNINAVKELVGKTFYNAIIGEYPNAFLDYSKIKITKGSLQLPTDISSFVEVESGKIVFTWNPNPLYPQLPGNLTDSVNIVCFNEKYPKDVIYFNGYKRSEGKATIELPQNWDSSETHIWIYLNSWDLQENSDSVYKMIFCEY